MGEVESDPSIATARSSGVSSGNRRGQKTRCCILEAAEHEFAHKGFCGASTLGIASRANVQQPLLNYHFGDKQALWRAAVSFGFAELSAALELLELGREGSQRSPDLRAVLSLFARFSMRHPNAVKILSIEAAGDSERKAYLEERVLEPARQILSDTLDRTVGKPLPEGWTLELLTSHLLSVALRPFPGRPHPATHVSAFVGLTLHGLCPSE